MDEKSYQDFLQGYVYGIDTGGNASRIGKSFYKPVTTPAPARSYPTYQPPPVVPTAYQPTSPTSPAAPAAPVVPREPTQAELMQKAWVEAIQRQVFIFWGVCAVAAFGYFAASGVLSRPGATWGDWVGIGVASAGLGGIAAILLLALVAKIVVPILIVPVRICLDFLALPKAHRLVIVGFCAMAAVVVTIGVMNALG